MRSQLTSVAHRFRTRPALTRLEDRATPAVVVNLTDDKAGSLRWAVNVCNTTADNLVEFANGLVGQITLTTGEIDITTPMTIAGPGAGVITVSGNNSSRIFHVDSLTIGLPVSISGLKFKDGLVPAAEAGGAILNADEALTLSKCHFLNNRAGTGGAIAVGLAAGSLAATDCFFEANKAGVNGGAVSLLAPSTVTVNNCFFAGNVAVKSGGGLAFQLGGSLTLQNTTLAQNQAVNDSGGGLFFSGSAKSLAVTQCTFSGNTAVNGGGVALSAFAGNLAMRNSTVHTNLAFAPGTGGGLAHLGGAGTVSLVSTIVSGNINAKAPDIASAVKIDASNCAIGAAAGFAFGVAAGNLPFGANLKLAPLAFNGGANPTHLQSGNSPVINKGLNPAPALAFDQRGAPFARVLNGVPDIGAVEVTAAPPQVAKVIINDGELQRSKVREVRVEFDAVVNLPSGPPSLWVELKHQVNGVLITLMPTVTHTDMTTATLTFSGPGTEAGSLMDGRYNLKLFAPNITGPGGMLDGNGDGVGGDDFLHVSTGMSGVYRLFGDTDGDADVDALDFAMFRGKFGSSGIIDPQDWDGDGDVDAIDFAALRLRFGTAL